MQSKYKGIEDGDWDDILTPDDYDLYIEMRQYEKANRRWFLNRRIYHMERTHGDHTIHLRTVSNSLH